MNGLPPQTIPLFKLGLSGGRSMLAMRLIRDQVPHLNSRYISISAAVLKKRLLEYSPLQLVKKNSLSMKDGETPSKYGELMVEAGECRTPRPREATQNILQA